MAPTFLAEHNEACSRVATFTYSRAVKLNALRAAAHGLHLFTHWYRPTGCQLTKATGKRRIKPQYKAASMHCPRLR